MDLIICLNDIEKDRAEELEAFITMMLDNSRYKDDYWNTELNW